MAANTALMPLSFVSLALFLILCIQSGYAAPTALSCKCGTGYSCCADKSNGYMCYKPSEYSCINGRLCQSGNQLCGTACYNPLTYQCLADGAVLCQLSEDVCMVQGKPACYNKQQYHCYNGNVLCGVKEGFCNGRCYSPAAYQCFNGTLCASTEGICLVNKQPQCFDKSVYQCFNNEVICSVAEQQCNGQCYSPTVYKCENGTLCSVDAASCSGGSPGSSGPIFCQGKSRGSPDACSGHGNCMATDTCACNSGYYGADCSVSSQQGAFCNSIPSTDPSVCTGRGVCSANNTCVCATGFSGANCETTVCPNGQSGPNCENFSCFNKASTDPSVCSGNGACIRPNTCSCKTGFYGRLCDKTGTANVKPCLFLVGQNDYAELHSYSQTFAPPMGGSMYGNIFESGLGPVMEDYLAKLNTNYPGSRVLFGLDAKAMFYYLYGGYDKTKNTAQMFKDIVAGKFNVDNNILSFATSLKKYTSLTIMMRIDYEVSGNLHANTNPAAWDTTTQDGSFYKQAFCKVANKFRELKANNVEFVYHPNRGDHMMLYPDPSCVDWIGFSVFNNDVVLPTFDGTTYNWNNQSGTVDMNLKRGFDWAKSTGKKVMIAESSVQNPNCNTVDGMRTYFDRVLSIVDTYQLDSWTFINTDWISKSWDAQWGNSRIDTKPVEFQQWWNATIVNSPKFIQY